MKQMHEEEAPGAPELSPELLDKLMQQVNPSSLLVHVKKGDIECLREVLGWELGEEFPDKEEDGFYPIVFTFDELKNLHSRLAAPYRDQINGDPMYKQTQEWTEDELIHAASAAAQITKSAIQYYQVEGHRRKSELSNEL